jgi:hypothetical protein
MKYIRAFAIVGVFLLFLITMKQQIKVLKQDLNHALVNLKAFDQERDSLSDRARVFEFKVSQLNYFNDSIVNKLNQTRRELGIKDG